jgi:hypothetical protein
LAVASTSAGGAVVVDNASVISQLNNGISLQNEEAVELNNLCRREFKRQIEHEEKKKDSTKNLAKKLHPAIMNMLKRAFATDHTDKKDEIAPTFLRFINSNNVGLAQYELIHQFKEGGFPDVTFASGTTQSLYLGDFLYSNSGCQATLRFLPSTSKRQIHRTSK